MSGPELKKQSEESVLQAAMEVVAVAIETPFKELEKLPKRIEQVLNDPKVQSSMEEALKKRALALLNQQQNQTHWHEDATAAVEAREAREKLLKEMGSETLKALRKSALRQISEGEQVRRLRREAEEFKKAFNNAPVGAWVDRNSGVVYLVGVVAAIGGVVGLWYTRSDLVGRPLELIDVTIPIGEWEVKGKISKFRPGSQRVEGQVEVTKKFQQIQAGLQLAGKYNNKAGQVVVEAKLSMRQPGQGSVALAGRLTSDAEPTDATRPGTIGLSPDDKEAMTRLRFDLGVETELKIEEGLNINLFAYLSQTDFPISYFGREAAPLFPGLHKINSQLDGLTRGLAISLRRNRPNSVNLDFGGFFETNHSDVRGGLQLRLDLP